MSAGKFQTTILIYEFDKTSERAMAAHLRFCVVFDETAIVFFFYVLEYFLVTLKKGTVSEKGNYIASYLQL